MTDPTQWPPAKAIEAAAQRIVTALCQHGRITRDMPSAVEEARAMPHAKYIAQSAILAALPLMGIAELMREAADEMQGTDNALAFHDVGDGDSKYPALLRAMADRIEGKTT